MTDTNLKSKKTIDLNTVCDPNFDDTFSHTNKIKSVLYSIINADKTAQRTVQRARIVLIRGEGSSKYKIRKQTKANEKTIITWCKRWYEALPYLVTLEEEEEASLEKLRKAVIDVLTDKQRSGAPLIFTSEQKTHIMALACEDPEDHEVPHTRWSIREIAARAVKEKIVSSISHGQVANFLKYGKNKTL